MHLTKESWCGSMGIARNERVSWRWFRPFFGDWLNAVHVFCGSPPISTLSSARWYLTMCFLSELRIAVSRFNQLRCLISESSETWLQMVLTAFEAMVSPCISHCLCFRHSSSFMKITSNHLITQSFTAQKFSDEHIWTLQDCHYKWWWSYSPSSHRLHSSRLWI